MFFGRSEDCDTCCTDSSLHSMLFPDPLIL
jgi:hypothetical protein